MGVYLCLGQYVHGLKHNDSIHINQFKTYTDIHQYVRKRQNILIYGEGKHKIKKKAEQIACDEAISILNSFQNSSK